MGYTLDDYEKKRDFGRTPEPAPEKRPARQGDLQFVIHRHDATHLHYDLRLEMGGALKSWAVPRGLSRDPAEKRLAVRTEDHPMEYLEFHGVIPKGEYGAGTMTIWDRGSYELLTADGAAGVAAGKLEIELRGRRFRGEWHLVLTKGGKGSDWLLFKANDRFVRKKDDDGPGADLSAASQAALPKKVELMTPAGVAEPFSDPMWVFEMEFAGLRCAAVRDGDRVTLLAGSRRGLEKRLADLVLDLRNLLADRFVLDGVLVVTDENGRPSRERLERVLREGGDDEVVCYAFDLLHYDAWDLRCVPLVERKAKLAEIIPRSGRVLYVDHVPGGGEKLVGVVRASGLAGVIAKEASGSYVGGPSPSWRAIPVDPDATAARRSVVETLGTGRKDAAPHAPGVRFSNLDKVFWPESELTKGDLVRYYDRVAEFILPHLEGRPVHMKRMPDGITGESFYQKDAPGHLPSWIETARIDSRSTDGKSLRYMICNTRRDLLYFANLASIDLHPWLSRVATPDRPDWAILDIDAKQSNFANAIKVARAIGKVLRAIELRGYLKTSGATGLHVYIPLLPGYTYEHTLAFCEGVARVIVKEHKDIATVARIPGQRGRRIYVDFGQNRRGQTVVPPYCARPVPGACVSAPLEWEELEHDLTPDRFTIATLFARLDRVGDLFRPVLEDRQDLLPAIERLQDYVRG